MKSHVHSTFPCEFFRELMIVKEAETEDLRITNCESTERERHLYTSKSNAIEVKLLSSNIDAPQFLVQYTGRLHVFLSWVTNLIKLMVAFCRTRFSRFYYISQDFVIHDDIFAVTGCRDPEIPKNSWMKRDGLIATIGCKGKKNLTWQLKCHDGVWFGSRGNCSSECKFHHFKY